MGEILSFKQVKLLIQQLRIAPEAQKEALSKRIYNAIKGILDILGSYGFQCVTDNGRCEDRLLYVYGNKERQDIQYERLIADIHTNMIDFRSTWETSHTNDVTPDNNPRFKEFERYYDFFVNLFNHLDSKKIWVVSTYSTPIGRLEKILDLPKGLKPESLNLEGIYTDLYEYKTEKELVEFLVIIVQDVSEAQIFNAFVHLFNLRTQGCDSIIFDLSPSTEYDSVLKKLRYVHQIVTASMDAISHVFFEMSENPDLCKQLYEGETSVNRIYMNSTGETVEPCQNSHYLITMYDRQIEMECKDAADKAVCGAEKAIGFGERYNELLGIPLSRYHFVFTKDNSSPNILNKSLFILAVKRDIQ